MRTAQQMVGDFMRAATAGTHGAPLGERLCRACVAAIPMDGAGISVRAGDGDLEVWGFSDTVAQQVERLQATLAEGPCHEALALRLPVLVPELAATNAPRWPVFASVITQQIGVSALFSFPLQVGGILLGTLDLHRKRPGALLAEELTACREVADTASLLMLQTVDPSADPLVGLGGGAMDAVVHQATGMVIVQLDVGPAEALARMRGRAFATGISLQALAVDIVDRQADLSEAEP